MHNQAMGYASRRLIVPSATEAAFVLWLVHRPGEADGIAAGNVACNVEQFIEQFPWHPANTGRYRWRSFPLDAVVVRHIFGARSRLAGDHNRFLS